MPCTPSRQAPAAGHAVWFVRSIAHASMRRMPAKVNCLPRSCRAQTVYEFVRSQACDFRFFTSTGFAAAVAWIVREGARQLQRGKSNGPSPTSKPLMERTVVRTVGVSQPECCSCRLPGSQGPRAREPTREELVPHDESGSRECPAQAVASEATHVVASEITPIRRATGKLPPVDLVTPCRSSLRSECPGAGPRRQLPLPCPRSGLASCPPGTRQDAFPSAARSVSASPGDIRAASLARHTLCHSPSSGPAW